MADSDDARDSEPHALWEELRNELRLRLGSQVDDMSEADMFIAVDTIFKNMVGSSDEPVETSSIVDAAGEAAIPEKQVSSIKSAETPSRASGSEAATTFKEQPLPDTSPLLFVPDWPIALYPDDPVIIDGRRATNTVRPPVYLPRTYSVDVIVASYPDGRAQWRREREGAVNFLRGVSVAFVQRRLDLNEYTERHNRDARYCHDTIDKFPHLISEEALRNHHAWGIYLEREKKARKTTVRQCQRYGLLLREFQNELAHWERFWDIFEHSSGLLDDDIEIDGLLQRFTELDKRYCFLYDLIWETYAPGQASRTQMLEFWRLGQPIQHIPFENSRSEHASQVDQTKPCNEQDQESGRERSETQEEKKARKKKEQSKRNRQNQKKRKQAAAKTKENARDESSTKDKGPGSNEKPAEQKDNEGEDSRDQKQHHDAPEEPGEAEAWPSPDAPQSPHFTISGLRLDDHDELEDMYGPGEVKEVENDGGADEREVEQSAVGISEITSQTDKQAHQPRQDVAEATASVAEPVVDPSTHQALIYTPPSDWHSNTAAEPGQILRPPMSDQEMFTWFTDQLRRQYHELRTTGSTTISYRPDMPMPPPEQSPAEEEHKGDAEEEAPGQERLGDEVPEAREHPGREEVVAEVDQRTREQTTEDGGEQQVRASVEDDVLHEEQGEWRTVPSSQPWWKKGKKGGQGHGPRR